MGNATRDFIPEGVDMTPNELANRNKHAAIRTGANHVDFIPDPSANEPTLRPSTSPEERADRAMDAAVARAKAATDADWDIAKTRLAGWNARQAIEAITRMPQQVMELYIIAEEDTGHRHDILSVFPTPRPEMYHRYAPALAAEKFVPQDELPVPSIASSLDEPETVVSEAPKLEATDEASADAEVFLCTDCDAEFKTVAGLKSHGRAKHGDAPVADETPQAAEEVAPQAGAQE
jgi:hypothetical protein